MALPTFKDEAEFREACISLPSLTKLGYILVTHSHGSDEQGKDFFFADFDRFEHVRFYAVQAKNGNIGGGNVELDKLLNQVRRCFRVRLRHYRGAEERRISAVYIMASGTISPAGREYIAEHCRSEPFGENVYFLDNDRLQRLEQFVHHPYDRDLRNQLVGLLNEAQYNTQPIHLCQIMFQQKRSTIYRCSGTGALSDTCSASA